MNAMDQWVLMVFYGIGAVAGLVACALAVLIGLVFCFQIPWWICRQTAAWIRIAKIVRKAARIRKRWKANEVNGSTPLAEPTGSTRVCVTHHYACDCREKAIRVLIRDLMELALDNRMDEDERSFVDPARRYVELRNEAVRLGYHHGKIIELSNAESEAPK